MGRPKDKFPCIRRNKQFAVLHTTAEFDFHIWNKNYTFPHKHDNYVEFFIVTNGTMFHQINDEQSVLIQKGDAGILLPGTIHAHFPHNNEKTSFINITCLSSFAETIVQHFYKKELHSLTSSVVRLTQQQLQSVISISDQISYSPQPLSQSLIPSLISYMFGIFCSQKKLVNTQTLPEWLHDFLFLLPNLDYETTKISDLYKLSNYSQSMLSIYFKQYMNTTLVEYVNQIKLTQACSLLEKTDLTTLAISNKIGFSSLAHFNHLFKKCFNLTPIQYRKLYQ